MATYKETIKISKKRADWISHCLSNVELSEDDTIAESAYFENGMVMDIKCCGAQDETAWTEAVLLIPNTGLGQRRKDEPGSCVYGECGCSDVNDEFVGEWKLEHNGDTYIAEVIVEE